MNVDIWGYVQGETPQKPELPSGQLAPYSSGFPARGLY